MVANWVFFAYTSLVSSLPSWPAAVNLYSCLPTKLLAEGDDQSAPVFASLLFRAGIVRQGGTEAGRRACLVSLISRCCPPGRSRSALQTRRRRTCPQPLSAPALARRGARQQRPRRALTPNFEPHAGRGGVQQGQAGRADGGDAQGAGRQADRPHLPRRRGRQRRGRGPGLAPALLQSLHAPGAAPRAPPAARGAAARRA